MSTATASRTYVYVDTTEISDDIDHIAVERVINTSSGPRPRLTRPEKECGARLLHERGHSVSSIANRLHLSYDTAREILGLPAEPAPAREPIRCGTRPGYRKHLRNGETTCDACRAANRNS